MTPPTIPLYCPKCKGVFCEVLPMIPEHNNKHGENCEGSKTLARFKVKQCPHKDKPDHKHDDCGACKGWIHTPIWFNIIAISRDTESDNAISLTVDETIAHLRSQNYNTENIPEMICAIYGGETISTSIYNLRSFRLETEGAK